MFGNEGFCYSVVRLWLKFSGWFCVMCVCSVL